MTSHLEQQLGWNWIEKEYEELDSYPSDPISNGL